MGLIFEMRIKLKEIRGVGTFPNLGGAQIELRTAFTCSDRGFENLPQLKVLLLDNDKRPGNTRYTINRQSFKGNANLQIFHSQTRLVVSVDAFNSLHHLESLGLTGTGMKWSFLPQIIKGSLCRCNMSSVQDLNLSGNKIQHLKPGLFAVFPNLRILSLEYNLLTSMFASTGNSDSSSHAFFEILLMPLHTLSMGYQGSDHPNKRYFKDSDLQLFQNTTIPEPVLHCDLYSNMFWLGRMDFSQKNSKLFSDEMKHICISLEVFTMQNVKSTFNASHFVRDTYDVTMPQNRLTHVDISGSDFILIVGETDSAGEPNITFNGLTTVKYLNVQAMNILTFFSRTLEELTQLETVLMGRNPHLGGSITSMTQCTFNHPNLKSFDLAFNNITTWPDSFLGKLPSLAFLNLSGNHLSDFNINLSSYPQLQFLNLSNNSVSELPTVAVNRNLIIDLTDNPLQCGCANIDFLVWFQDTSNNIRFYNVDKLTCSHPLSGTAFINRIDVAELRRYCFPSSTRLVLITVACISAFLLVLALLVVLYRQRRRIRQRSNIPVVWSDEETEENLIADLTLIDRL
ncbi:hypothetical protein CAPTEDRAFT_202127 [Capitella teleta]|uniref:LRRCT domain-containing protein n=1 Tax=Capitella teleta TaxID=283909 RepID=R7U305_CAPTE|nr:hypothetical protein CAPTEDRAFT_202127 [Capitella teleta]|eukprot:ELU00730.1 hypothetical protein CAPTEDRAFT_202127 [Capitella teleta]